MKILFIGDIVGKPGRELIRKGLRPSSITTRGFRRSPTRRTSAAGFGITKDIGDALLGWGVDVMTSGNHIWDKKEAIRTTSRRSRDCCVRPTTLPASPGRGSYVAQTGDGRAVGVVNVDGPRLHARASTTRSPWS